MTLDEAIAHCEEVSKSACGECAEEHRQLAEWLKELRERRQNERHETVRQMQENDVCGQPKQQG